MATQSAVWIPNTEGGTSASLMAPNGDSGVIFLGKNRIFRIWTDNTSGISISFGLGAGMAAPTTSSYAIGTIPQDFDLGFALDSIRLVNNSGISSAHYFIQALNRN